MQHFNIIIPPRNCKKSRKIIMFSTTAYAYKDRKGMDYFISKLQMRFTFEDRQLFMRTDTTYGKLYSLKSSKSLKYF